jgi:hypothetical protein
MTTTRPTLTPGLAFSPRADSMQQHVRAAEWAFRDRRSAHVPEGMTMVQATDDDAMTADNVRPIRPDVTPEPQLRRERRKDHRAAARKAKSRSKNKADRDASAARATPVYAPPIAPADAG